MSALTTRVTAYADEKGHFRQGAAVQASCADCGCEWSWRITGYGSWRVQHECGLVWQCYRNGPSR